MCLLRLVMFHLRAFASLAAQRNKRRDKFRLLLPLSETYFLVVVRREKGWWWRIVPPSCYDEKKQNNKQVQENLFDWASNKLEGCFLFFLLFLLFLQHFGGVKIKKLKSCKWGVTAKKKKKVKPCAPHEMAKKKVMLIPNLKKVEICFP